MLRAIYELYAGPVASKRVSLLWRGCGFGGGKRVRGASNSQGGGRVSFVSGGQKAEKPICSFQTERKR